MSDPALMSALDRTSTDRTGKGRTEAAREAVPAPRPVASAPRAARIPAADDLLAPHGEPSLDGADAATLTAVIRSYVKQVYEGFQHAQGQAFAALQEPPPAADRPFALTVLAKLVGALASYATGGLASLVAQAAEDKLGGDAKATLTKSLSAVSGAAVEAITAPARPAGPPAPPGPGTAPANPAAATLLAELELRQQLSLEEQRGRAERQLLVAGAAMNRAEPGALRALAEALARRVEAPSLYAEYISRVCTGWLELCSAISLGPRAEGETAMPGANRTGGAPPVAWRQAHAGFVEIEVDFPEEVDELAGAAVGRISVASGPGAARILRQSGHTLGELPVYRRLWLGTQRLDRSPDLVITPEHGLEVNERSSLLAAIAVRRRGRLRDLAAEGGTEERERARLLERREHTAAPPSAHREPGRLGSLVEAHRPIEGERTEQEERRLVALDLRRQLRAAAAQEGARALWAWVGATPSERLS